MPAYYIHNHQFHRPPHWRYKRQDEKKAGEEKRLRRYTELRDLELQKMNLPPVYGSPDNRTFEKDGGVTEKPKETPPGN